MVHSLYRLSQYYYIDIMRGRYLPGVGGYRLRHHLLEAKVYNVEVDRPILPMADDWKNIVHRLKEAEKEATAKLARRSTNPSTEPSDVDAAEVATTEEIEVSHSRRPYEFDRLTVYEKAPGPSSTDMSY